MKKAVRFIFVLLAVLVLFLAGKALLYGRWTAGRRAAPPRIELSFENAMEDGVLTPEEIAVHYAPEVHAAVNVLISSSGKGDFISAVDFDGDLNARNNWEHMPDYPLQAVVYWSVQETDTHYYVGYDFYHPRDDAEIWLDKHENDFEGIMLAVPKAGSGFLPPACMYTQGHGGVSFYGEGLSVSEGSRFGGPLALDGDRPVIYITPNGTLSHAGHSIESEAGHSLYWSVGNSGIRYYHGGEAGEPLTFKGRYENNPCSYRLEPLKTLWEYRNGPYGEGHIFSSYGAFAGDNYRENAANPAWAWRNKTEFGFGGSFLSDPAWTFSRALDHGTFSPRYTLNPFADWVVSVQSVHAPSGKRISTLRLWQGGWLLSSPEWWRIGPDGAVEIAGEGRESLWIAAPRDSSWRLEAVDEDGGVIRDAEITWSAALMPLTEAVP